jgi:hypothetical protein
VEWFLSSVNATLDDVLPDGCLRVFVDGVSVYAGSGLKVYCTDVGWPSGINSFDVIQFGGDGWCDDIVISDDTQSCLSLAGGSPPPNESTPCCGSGPDPTDPNPSTTPNPGNVPVPLQPWTPQCDGGGMVPSAADVTDVEVWTL